MCELPITQPKSDPEYADFRYQSMTFHKYNEIKVIGGLESVKKLRKYELFPIPMRNIDFARPGGILEHGAVFDIIDCGDCDACKAPGRIINSNNMFICNLCGYKSHCRDMTCDQSNVNGKITDHLSSHRIYDAEDTPKTFYLAYANMLNNQNIRRTAVCKNRAKWPNPQNEKECCDPVKCIMCGLQYMEICNKISNFDIKNHLETCTEVIKLRTNTNTLPINHMKDGSLPAPPAKHHDNKRISKFQNNKKINNAATSCIVKNTFCKECNILKTECQFCKGSSYTNLFDKVFLRKHIGVHVIQMCISDHMQYFMLNHSFPSVTKLSGTFNLFAKDRTVTIFNRLLNGNNPIDFVRGRKCIYCGFEYAVMSADIIADHIITVHHKKE